MDDMRTRAREARDASTRDTKTCTRLVTAFREVFATLDGAHGKLGESSTYQLMRKFENDPTPVQCRKTFRVMKADMLKTRPSRAHRLVTMPFPEIRGLDAFHVLTTKHGIFRYIRDKDILQDRLVSRLDILYRWKAP